MTKNSFIKSLRLIICLLFLQVFSTTAYAFDATLNWSTWDDSQYIDHFKIYWGTSPGNYTFASENIYGNQTTFTITGLTDGQVYYFAMKSFESKGNSSFFSSEITKGITTTFAINSPESSFYVNLGNYTSYSVYGTGTPSSSVEVLEGMSSTSLGTTTIDGSGNWIINVDFTPINQGTVTIKVIQDGTINSEVSGHYDRIVHKAPSSFSVE